MELCPQGEIVPAPYVQSRLLTRAMCEVNEDDVISSPGDGNILNKLRKLSLWDTGKTREPPNPSQSHVVSV